MLSRPLLLGLLMLAGCTAPSAPVAHDPELAEGASRLHVGSILRYGGPEDSTIEFKVVGDTYLRDLAGDELDVLAIQVIEDGSEWPWTVLVDPFSGAVIGKLNTCLAVEGESECFEAFVIHFYLRGHPFALNLDAAAGPISGFTAFGEPAALALRNVPVGDCEDTFFDTTAAVGAIGVSVPFYSRARYCGSSVPVELDFRGATYMLHHHALGAGRPVPPWAGTAGQDVDLQVAPPSDPVGLSYPVGRADLLPFQAAEVVDAARHVNGDVEAFLADHADAHVSYFDHLPGGGEVSAVVIGNVTTRLSRNVRLASLASGEGIAFHVERQRMLDAVDQDRVSGLSRTAPRSALLQPAMTQVSLSDARDGLASLMPNELDHVLVGRTWPAIGPDNGQLVGQAYIYSMQFDGVQLSATISMNYRADVNAETGQLLELCGGDDLDKMFDTDLTRN